MGLYDETALNEETADKISQMLGVSKKDVLEMEQRLNGDSSLNTCLAHDSATDRQDMLVDGSESVEEKIGNSQDMMIKKKLLGEALATLSEREQEIVKRRFLTENPETLENLGAYFHISRERVRQIETKAFDKMSRYMKAEAARLVI